MPLHAPLQPAKTTFGPGRRGQRRRSRRRERRGAGRAAGERAGRARHATRAAAGPRHGQRLGQPVEPRAHGVAAVDATLIVQVGQRPAPLARGAAPARERAVGADGGGQRHALVDREALRAVAAAADAGRRAGHGAEPVADERPPRSPAASRRSSRSPRGPAVSVTVQEPVPLRGPVHPANVEPAAGAAVSVIDVPCAAVCVQSVPQLMPVPVTVPEPVPARVTVSVLSVRAKRRRHIARLIHRHRTAAAPRARPAPADEHAVDARRRLQRHRRAVRERGGARGGRS